MSLPIQLGRAPTSDIAVADESVSWSHAELLLTPEQHLFVTDCGSRNGTFLIGKNGQKTKIRQSTLRRGESILFGECLFSADALIQLVQEVKERRAAASPQPPSPAKSDSVRWVRCECGAIYREKEHCTVCTPLGKRAAKG